MKMRPFTDSNDRVKCVTLNSVVFKPGRASDGVMAEHETPEYNKSIFDSEWFSEAKGKW